MNFRYYTKKAIYKIFKSIFLTLNSLQRVLPPRYVVWDSTRRCNLDCEHCGAKSGHYGRELTTDQVKRFIEEISCYGVKMFSVTGGEPFLRSDLQEILAYGKKYGLKTAVATNGSFIKEDNVSSFASVVDSVMISLDGPEDVHNKIRRSKDSYRNVLKSFSLLRKQPHLFLTAASTITKSNSGHLEAIREIVRDLGLHQWRLNALMPIGNAQGHHRLALDERGIRQLFIFIEKNRKKTPIIVGENFGSLGKYETRLRDEPFFCPVGYLACCLGCDGSIRGCPEQPDNDFFQEGNIFQESFRNIWERAFRKYRTTDHLESQCRSCPDGDLCAGGCWVMKTKEMHCCPQMYNLWR